MKYLKAQSLKLVEKVLPKLPQATTFRIVQTCTLAIPSKVDAGFDWWRHKTCNSITNKQYWVARMGLECSFGNQLIGLNEFARRSYTMKFFKERQIQDFYDEYHHGRDHLIHNKQSEKKAPYPSAQRNMFIYANSLRYQDLLEIEPMKTKCLTKIVCYSTEQSLQLDKQLEEFCLKHNVRLLPMKELSVERILRYIIKNTRGNILINEMPDDKGEYILNPTDTYLQPRKLFLMCEELPKSELKLCTGEPFLHFKQIAKSYQLEHNGKLNKLSLLDLTRGQDFVQDSEEEDDDEDLDQKAPFK